ncbi:MAG: hypothetical protein ACN6OP_13525 [Pseudomonadales bacterium]
MNIYYCDAGDKQTWGLADNAERYKEQARQNSINKAVQDGQRKIDDAVTSRAAGSLQRTADDLTGKAAVILHCRPHSLGVCRPVQAH